MLVWLVSGSAIVGQMEKIRFPRDVNIIIILAHDGIRTSQSRYKNIPDEFLN